MIGIGAAGARGTNGTLSPATARTRCGCSSDIHQVTFAPQSCPTKIADCSPAQSSSPLMSSHSVTTS